MDCSTDIAMQRDERNLTVTGKKAFDVHVITENIV
jgi:hypothetical protein